MHNQGELIALGPSSPSSSLQGEYSKYEGGKRWPNYRAPQNMFRPSPPRLNPYKLG